MAQLTLLASDALSMVAIIDGEAIRINEGKSLVVGIFTIGFALGIFSYYRSEAE